jgi:hypothetical protein
LEISRRKKIHSLFFGLLVCLSLFADFLSIFAVHSFYFFKVLSLKLRLSIEIIISEKIHFNKVRLKQSVFRKKKKTMLLLISCSFLLSSSLVNAEASEKDLIAVWSVCGALAVILIIVGVVIYINRKKFFRVCGEDFSSSSDDDDDDEAERKKKDKRERVSAVTSPPIPGISDRYRPPAFHPPASRIVDVHVDSQVTARPIALVPRDLNNVNVISDDEIVVMPTPLAFGVK